MRFRPCIDLHEGKVKQIVGGTLRDGTTDGLVTNFETDASPASFASIYRRDGLSGGHVIMLGPGNGDAALGALAAFPNGLQAGGGITPANARTFLDGGASHVIITSYVFSNGAMDRDRLKEASGAIGRSRLVLDLSCRKKGDEYLIVTDRWQNFTSLAISGSSLEELASDCDEFLVHAADVEGLRQGIDEELVRLLGEFSPVPVTYAGGIRTIEDLERVKSLGRNRVDATIGSALDIFGGKLKYEDVVRWQRGQG